MKKDSIKFLRIIPLMLLILSMLSCGSLVPKKNPVYKEKTVAQFLESQNFTVKKPDSWFRIASHGLLLYSPEEGRPNFNFNRTYIKQLQNGNQNTLSLFAETDIAKGYKMSIKKVRKNLLIEDSNLGKLYIFPIKPITNSKAYLVYFEKGENYYLFKYFSREDLFDKYFQEAIDILASFKLK